MSRSASPGNAEYLAGHLALLRLRVRRRLAWLRHAAAPPPLDVFRGAVVSEAQATAAAAGPHRAAEQEFLATDSGALSLGAAIAAAERDLRDQAQALAAAGSPPALLRLREVFDLPEPAVGLLLLAAAPDLDPAFERMFAFVQDDAGRRFASLALATGLFGWPVEAPGLAYEALRPLLYHRLARLDAADPVPRGLASQAVRAEPRVVQYLQGVDQLDAALAPHLRRVAALAPPPRYARLAVQLAAAARRSPSAVVNLVEEAAGAGRVVAAELATLLGRDLHLADGAALAADPALAAREAALANTLYLVEVGGDEAEIPPIAGAEPLLVSSAEPVTGPGPMMVAPIPDLGEAEQRAVWKAALGGRGRGLNGAVDAVIHHFRLPPGAVTEVVAAATARARSRDTKLAAADLWQAARAHGRRRLGELARRIEPVFGWDDIVLPPDVRRQLEELAAHVRHRARVHEAWGFGAKLARGGGVAALFAGPSGTGKTMAAEIVAGELELDLYRIDLSGVVSKYIGETEKNLRRVFTAAEQSGAVLFFDEADALFGKRTEVRDSHDRYANIEIDYLLQQMEDYRGLAILATNRKSVLDRAFLRRLRFLVEFPFPAADGRLRIWQRVFPDGAPLASVDYGALARLEVAGGNIRSIAINAAFLAAADGGEITMDLLMHAARREYAKLDKTLTAAEFGGYLQGGAA